MKMAMLPRAPKKAAPETPAGNTAPVTTAGPAAANAPAAAAAGEAAPASTSTAVAVPAAAAVAVRVPVGKQVNVMQEDFKNKFPLDWNTLHRLQFNQGSVLDMENGKRSLGAEIELELMTYQDNWQISPSSNDPGASDVVRYSNDGITTTQGENCQEFIASAIEQGWTGTKMTQRVTMAGTLTKCNNPELVGKLVQIDLSSTSKGQFDRHCFQVAVDVSKGLRLRETCAYLKVTATPQSQGDKSWTMAVFTYGTVPVA